MQTKKSFYKWAAMLLCMGILTSSLFTACKPAEDTSASSAASAFTNSLLDPNYKEKLMDKVEKGMDGLALRVMYQTTGSWSDAVLGDTDTQGLTLEGEANRAFIRIQGVTEDVYQNIMFTLEVARKDGAPAYAAITPLNLGGALPAFVLSYAQDTELTDYVISVTGDNQFDAQVRKLDVPKPEGDMVVKEGTAFPGDMVEVNGKVYFYSGPNRTMYEIGPVAQDGTEGFTLTAGASLVSAEKLYATAEEWAAEPKLFSPDAVTIVDAETKQAENWPVSNGYAVKEEILVPDTQYQTRMNAQTVLAKVEWSRPVGEQTEENQKQTEDAMLEALDKFLLFAFEFKQGDTSLYLMSSNTYFMFVK